MANSKHIRSLIDMAEDDLAFARDSLQSPRHARYHVGQSAEKAVKALLEHRGLNPGREHRFDSMAEMLPPGDEWRVRVKSFDARKRGQQ